MQQEYGRPSSPSGMPSNNSPGLPPSPPPPSPTRSISPAPTSPSRPLSPSLVPSSIRSNSPFSGSPPVSPNLALFPHTGRPLSPPHLGSPTTALTRPPTSHSRRTSLQSISIMPPIREDSNSIFSDVSQRRSKSSFYQYGEDYITAYDMVGLMSSPSPRPGSSRASARSARSLRTSVSGRSAKSGKSGRSGYSLASLARSTRGESSSERASDAFTGHLAREAARERDLEHGPASEPESEVEKGDMMETSAKESWWRRWRRFFIILMVVIALAGFAVGIIFGTRTR